MPQRRLPLSNSERLSAMRIITERISVTPPADLPFTAATLARLAVHYPMYKGLRDQLDTALSAQTTQTATVKPLRHAAKLWVSHGFQSIINATVRGALPSSMLGYYGLAVGARRVPSMGSEQAILSAGVMLSNGEQARVAAGGVPISFPSLAEIDGHVDAFRQANLLQAQLKTAYDEAQEALANALADTDMLVLRLWNEIETACDTGDKPSLRRKASEWGVVYVPSNNEVLAANNWAIAGKVTNGQTPLFEAVITVEGTAIATSTDSRGRFYIPTLEAGIYTLRIEKESYTTQHIPIALGKGIVRMVKVILVT